MPDDVRAPSGNRDMKQEQPRRAPARGRNLLLYYVIGALAVLTLAVGGIYVFKPAWLSFLGPGGGIAVQPEARVVFDGHVAGLNAGQGNSVVQGAQGGEATVIIRSQQANAQPGGTTQGAFVKLSPEISSDINGKRARVTIWARAAAQNPSKLFGIAFSRAGIGTTGWIAFEPTNEMKPYGFGYRVPDVPSGKTSPGDFIGIWSDVTGQNGGLEVQRITIQAVALPPPRKKS